VGKSLSFQQGFAHQQDTEHSSPVGITSAIIETDLFQGVAARSIVLICHCEAECRSNLLKILSEVTMSIVIICKLLDSSIELPTQDFGL
jgi:hypothetical protein